MKHIIFSLLLLGFSANLFAQKIVSVRDNGKAPYAYAGERLNARELSAVLQSNPEAFQMYEDTKSSRFTSLFFGSVGGYLIGNQVGKMISLGNGYGRNALMWGGGLALIGTSLAMDGGANKRKRQAVELYNQDLPRKDDSSPISLELGTTSNGVGLVFSF